MSAVYSGGPITVGNFLADSSSNLVEGVRTKLLLSNWTDVSGSVGDRIMQSVETPQGLQCRVRMYHSGAELSTRFSFRDTAASPRTMDVFFAPNRGRVPTVRIIANPYQFFLFYPYVLHEARTFIAGGCPKIEDFQASVVTTAIWCQGNATNDTNTVGGMRSFRETGSTRGADHWGSLFNDFTPYSTGTGIGAQRITFHQPATHPIASSVGYPSVWGETLEAIKDPARIAWGLSSGSVASRILGPIWDAVAIGECYPSGLQSTFDGHIHENITTDYFNLQGNHIRFSLWVAVT